MTTIEAIIFLLGTSFLIVSIAFLVILAGFHKLLSVFISDSITRHTAHLQAVEDGYIEEDTEALEPGVVRYSQEDLITANAEREHYAELGIKRWSDGE